MSEKVTEFFDRATEKDAKATSSRIAQLLENGVNLETYEPRVVTYHPQKVRPLRDAILIWSALSIILAIVSFIKPNPEYPSKAKLAPVSLNALIREPLAELSRNYTPTPKP